MRHDDVGQGELGLQFLHQVDDLRLDRHVERRDGLVGHDELRAEREGTGEADALPLSTGQLVRKALQDSAWQPDAVEQFGYPGILFCG